MLAAKVKMGPKEALALAATVSRIIASKGQKVQTLDLKKNLPSEADILAVLLGPTGNLRAPTAVVGDTLLVGFHPEAYRTVLG